MKMPLFSLSLNKWLECLSFSILFMILVFIFFIVFFITQIYIKLIIRNIIQHLHQLGKILSLHSTPLHFIFIIFHRITGLYCSSLDFVLTQAIPVIIPGLIFDFPIVIAWLGTIVGSLNSIHSHSCYTFPFLPTPLDHDAHHAKFNCWFATGPFDLLFGTTSQQIKKRREERMKME